MAAPGTITHVLEVAKQLAAAADTHAATLTEQAAAAVVDLNTAAAEPSQM